LVLQLNAEHSIGQRLDDRGHHFDGVLFSIAGVVFLLFLRFVEPPFRHKLLFQLLLQTGAASSAPTKNPPPTQQPRHRFQRLRQNRLGYQAGPVTPLGRVKIHGPLAVTATVCSKCAEGLPSAVSATHSSRMRTSGRPALTIGSTAMTMPSCSLEPRPASP